jgi:hypothetical protein
MSRAEAQSRARRWRACTRARARSFPASRLDFAPGLRARPVAASAARVRACAYGPVGEHPEVRESEGRREDHGGPTRLRARRAESFVFTQGSFVRVVIVCVCVFGLLVGLYLLSGLEWRGHWGQSGGECASE